VTDRRSWLAGGLVAAVLMVFAGFLLVQDRDEPQAEVKPPQPTVESSPSPTPVELSWVEAGGVALPVSATHGPWALVDGLASGWSQSEEGAALAAAHLLVRSGPTAGPEVFEPTITGQTTGPNVAALKLAVNEQYAELEPAATDPRGLQGDAQLIGYRVAAFDLEADAAVIDLVLDSTQLSDSERFLQVTVSLEWLNDDWWLVAPPKGDWALVSTPLGALPDGLQRYEDLA
jgi:hypothetical protein